MKQTDYLIVGAGAMGLAFADEIFHKTKAKITIVDRRACPGGHWNDAYPFVRLHQPAAYYGVNSQVLGNGTTDLSSKAEILNYYQRLIKKFEASGRVEYLARHNYLGNGEIAEIPRPNEIIKVNIKRRLVDATYMNVQVPSTHTPKYIVDKDVPFIPINGLVDQYNNWDEYYVIGNGKTGIDAVLYLLNNGVSENSIHWICPNQAWLINREDLQVGNGVAMFIKQLDILRSTKNVTDFFLQIEESAGIVRIDQNNLPKKWRCATVSHKEIQQLRRIKNVISKGRVTRITKNKILLQHGIELYPDRSLFIDCSANALSRENSVPIFSDKKITLQPVIFCQQVFGAAAIARMELTNKSNQEKNHLTPIPHPEIQEDWPYALSRSIENLVHLNRCFPLWMFRARLNIMSHETLASYIFNAAKAAYFSATAIKNAKKLDAANTAILKSRVDNYEN